MIVSEHYDLSYLPGNHLFGRSERQREKEKRIRKEFAHFKRKEASTSTSAEAGKLFILFFHEPNDGRDLFNVAIINCSPIYFFSRLIFYLLFQVVCSAQEQKLIPGCCCRIALA